MNGADQFQEVIFAKTNAPEVVRRELGRRSWRGDNVVIGTATDPYQQAESKYRITRGILEAFRDFRNPVSITTKSPMVLRDLDLLAELARHAEVTVHFTVTTLDEALWRKIEPTTSKPHKRIEAMRTLREHGVRSGIFLSPVLPGLTDDTPHLEAVIAAAAQAGADFLVSQVLRLGPGISEYYLPFIQAEFPTLAPRYKELYRRNSPPGVYSQVVQRRVGELKERYGIPAHRAPAKQRMMPAPPATQLSLFGAT